MNIKEEEVDNVVPFERPQLAADPKDPEGPDWLRALPENARFIAKIRANNSEVLPWFGVAQVLPRVILLATDHENVPTIRFIWVDSRKFSRKYEFVCILPEREKPDGEAGNEYHLPRPADGQDHDGRT